MGCDGGTIPKRDELVRQKKKKEQKDPDSERLYLWGHCSVSQRPLKKPIVCCQLGRLYNKEEIINILLNKSQESKSVTHIKSMKDFKEVVLHQNPAWEEAAHRGGENEKFRSQWSCPLTGLEMNGKHGFSFNWGCGCVSASRALDEIHKKKGGQGKTHCVICSGPVEVEDYIVMNAKDDQLKMMEANMSERKAKAKAAKKGIKREVVDSEPGTSGVKKARTIRTVEKKDKQAVSISGVASSILRGTEFDRLRADNFSVANNDKNSEAFKSIFDTHKSAQKKLKSNWVTCNPQYY